jgi:mRNA interferase MazF
VKQINQGDIYLANLNPVKGHEQAGLRPVLVLQNNILNRNLNTIVIAPITSNLEAKGLMTTYFLSGKESGLKKDSVALLYQIRTIDKTPLKKEVGHISKKDFSQIRVKMMRVFW